MISRRGMLGLLGAGALVAQEEPRRIFSFLWNNPLVIVPRRRGSTLTTFDAILKAHYTDSKISELLYYDNPLLGMVARA